MKHAPFSLECLQNPSEQIEQSIMHSVLCLGTKRWWSNPTLIREFTNSTQMCESCCVRACVPNESEVNTSTKVINETVCHFLKRNRIFRNEFTAPTFELKLHLWVAFTWSPFPVKSGVLFLVPQTWTSRMLTKVVFLRLNVLRTLCAWVSSFHSANSALREWNPWCRAAGCAPGSNSSDSVQNKLPQLDESLKYLAPSLSVCILTGISSVAGAQRRCSSGYLNSRVSGPSQTWKFMARGSCFPTRCAQIWVTTNVAYGQKRDGQKISRCPKSTLRKETFWHSFQKVCRETEHI